KYFIKGDRPNGRPFYLWQMVVPTGLMFLIAPEIAATAVFVLGLNVVSTFGYQHQIAYHYSMAPLAGLVLGTVYAISRLKKETGRKVAVFIVAGSSLWAAFIWGPYPFSVHNNVPHLSPSYSSVVAINRLERRIPANAVVSSYYAFAPHIAHRKQIYMWPTPFAAVDWSTFKQEGQRLPRASKVEYLLLPPQLD